MTRIKFVSKNIFIHSIFSLFWKSGEKKRHQLSPAKLLVILFQLCHQNNIILQIWVAKPRLLMALVCFQFSSFFFLGRYLIPVYMYLLPFSLDRILVHYSRVGEAHFIHLVTFQKCISIYLLSCRGDHWRSTFDFFSTYQLKSDI